MDEELKIIGVSIRTNNKNKKAAQDITELWERFYLENVMSKIPHKLNQDIYVIYTDYDSDFKGDYTCIIGCKVKVLENIPADFIGRKLPPQKSRHYLARGKMPMSIVNVWNEIWENDAILNRSYKYDYELYGVRSADKDSPEVDVFIGIKD